MKTLHVKKGDNVLILAGKDKGQSGRIVAVNPTSRRVVVDGLNIITRHHKGRSAQDTSRIEKVNGSVDASNVQIICPSCNKATRVAMVFGEVPEGGKKPLKIRTCKKCGASLDQKGKSDKTVKDAKKSVKKAAKPAKAEAAPEATETPAKKAPAKKAPAKKAETTEATAAAPAKKAPAKKAAAEVTEAEAPAKKAPAKKAAAKKTAETSGDGEQA